MSVSLAGAEAGKDALDDVGAVLNMSHIQITPETPGKRMKSVDWCGLCLKTRGLIDEFREVWRGLKMVRWPSSS